MIFFPSPIPVRYFCATPTRRVFVALVSAYHRFAVGTQAMYLLYEGSRATSNEHENFRFIPLFVQFAFMQFDFRNHKLKCMHTFCQRVVCLVKTHTHAKITNKKERQGNVVMRLSAIVSRNYFSKRRTNAKHNCRRPLFLYLFDFMKLGIFNCRQTHTHTYTPSRHTTCEYKSHL